MRKLKMTAAGLFALVLALGMAACGAGNDSGDSTGNANSAESMPEKKLEESQQDIVNRLADDMTDVRELASNEIDWFSFYDINPTASADKEIGVDLALFQTKYNGKINYIQTTWDTKFDDLAKLIMAGNSPDFIGADDMDVFPKGAIKSMIEPIDD